MDAPETEVDVRLQRTSKSLLDDLQSSIQPFLWKTTRLGKLQIRRRVRVRETDRLVALLEPFQELPQLLDPHLDKLVPGIADALLAYLRAPPQKHPTTNTKLLTPLSNAICRLLYTFCKIRGEKVIVRFFSTETRHLELLLSALEKGSEADAASKDSAWGWEERYIALLWLSQLLLAPFDLATISSEDTADITTDEIADLEWPADTPAVTRRVVTLAIGYLSASGKEKDAAKVLLVRVAMRKDMQELGMLSALVQWALTRLRSVSHQDALAHDYVGILSFLAGLLAASLSTSDMNVYLPTIFSMVQTIPDSEEPVFQAIYAWAVARKIIIKILRTITILLLRNPESAANIEMVQGTIGYLLDSLADSATPVRLAASKALSMIALKLDPEMASQVVEAVLDALQKNVFRGDLSRVNPAEWHGVILTLSHLLYRRSVPASDSSLILNVFDALRLGLSFEQRSTSGASIGTNVRDASCFGIWSLARRYTTTELEGLRMKTDPRGIHQATDSALQILATELVVSASLDSAGNIRRGSSAALQELIGRHPNIIAEGIQVVQVVDYHAVALRARAVQEVALQAAPLSDHYYRALITGLLGWRGLRDADASARRNAASALGDLVWAKHLRSNTLWKDIRDAMNRVVGDLRKLAPRETDARHGLILALASITKNVSRHCTNSPMAAEFTSMYNKLQGSLNTAHASEISTEESPFCGVICEVIKQVSWILSEVETLSPNSRHPELLAEATSCLLGSTYPILRVDCVFRKLGPLRHEMKTQSDVLASPLLNQPSFDYGLDSTTLTRGFMGIQGTYEHGYPPNQACVDGAIRLQSKFLKLSDSSCVDVVSDAAANLLLMVNGTQRDSLISEWIESMSFAPKVGAQGACTGSLYTLFKIFPRKKLGGMFLMSWESDIIQAVRKRWDADHHIEIRATILRCLAASPALHTHTSSFGNLIKEGLEDYTTNARGDIGSLVRIDAIKAAGAIWSSNDVLDEVQTDSLQRLFGKVLRVASEKLDRVRTEGQKAVAGALVDSSIFSTLTPSSQKYFEHLLFLQTHPESMKGGTWKHEWSLDLMEGLVTSADTGSEDLVRASRAAIVAFAEEGRKQMLGTCLLQVLERSLATDRICVPVLEVLGFLFDVRILQDCKLEWARLYFLVQKAHFKSGNVRKIEAAVKVYGGLMEVYPKAAEKLSSMLVHQYPKIRNLVAEELWVQKDGVASLKRVDWTKAKKAEIEAVRKEIGITR